MKRWERLYPALAFVAPLLVFHRVLGHGFVDWDDPKNFLENPFFRGLSAANLEWMVSTLHTTAWQPLTWLTHGVDFSLWGLDPAAFHRTDLVLYACAAAAVYLLFLELAGAALPALLAALLFALHPLRVEVAAWASNRSYILVLLFSALSARSYLRREHWPALGFFLLSVLSKPLAVLLPLVYLVLDVHPLRRREPRWARVVEKLPFFLLSALGVGMGFAAKASGGLLAGLSEAGWGDRVFGAAYGAVHYPLKTLAPWDLNPVVLADPAAQVFPWTPAYWFSAAALAGAAWAAWRWRARAPWFGAVLASYLLLLAPVSGLARYGLQIASDKWSALPSLALFAGLAAGLARVDARRRSAAYAVCAAALAASSIGSFRLSGIWRDSVSLWTYAAAAGGGSAFADNNLGNIRRRQGDRKEAERLFRRALERLPGYSHAEGNLEALHPSVAGFERLVRKYPTYAGAYHNLGVMLAREGEHEAAAAAHARAVELLPEDADFRAAYAGALLKTGASAAARREFERVLRLDPANPEANFRLGLLDLAEGRAAQGRRRVFHAAARAPRDPEYRNARGRLLMNEGRLREAVADFEAALGSDATFSLARQNLEEARRRLRAAAPR